MILPHPFYSNWDGNPALSLRPTFLSPLGLPSFLFVSSFLSLTRRLPERTPSAPVDFRNASSSGHFVETCCQLHRRVRAVEGSDDFPLRCWVFLDSLPLRGEILLRHGPLRTSLLYLPRTLVTYLDAWRRIKRRESARLVPMPGVKPLYKMYDTFWTARV